MGTETAVITYKGLTSKTIKIDLRSFYHQHSVVPVDEKAARFDVHSEDWLWVDVPHMCLVNVKHVEDPSVRNHIHAMTGCEIVIAGTLDPDKLAVLDLDETFEAITFSWNLITTGYANIVLRGGHIHRAEVQRSGAHIVFKECTLGYMPFVDTNTAFMQGKDRHWVKFDGCGVYSINAEQTCPCFVFEDTTVCFLRGECYIISIQNTSLSNVYGTPRRLSKNSQAYYGIRIFSMGDDVHIEYANYAVRIENPDDRRKQYAKLFGKVRNNQ